MIETRKLKDFANMNGWIVINESGPEDEKVGDKYIRYLTPQGVEVLVKFYKDGSIDKVIC